MRILFIFLFFHLFSSPVFAKKYDYEVSVAAIFKNEARWLKEWIEYHRLIGVDHFYLYNNCSDDNYREVLSPYIQKKIVTLKEWPYRYKNNDVSSWTKIQTKAYNHAIKKARSTSNWLAVLDVDEFIVLMKHRSLPQMLSGYKKVGGITMHWQLFGTSFVKEIPADKLMLETLTLKAHPTYGENAFVKSIFHPRRVREMTDPHYAHYMAGYQQVNTIEQPVQGSINHFWDLDIARVHHYWSKDEKFFYERKCPRRQHWNEGFDGQLGRLANLNMVEDHSLDWAFEPLRKRMGLY